MVSFPMSGSIARVFYPVRFQPGVTDPNRDAGVALAAAGSARTKKSGRLEQLPPVARASCLSRPAPCIVCEEG